MMTNGPGLTLIHLDTTLLISPANLQPNCLLLISLLSILSQVCCSVFLGLPFPYLFTLLALGYFCLG